MTRLFLLAALVLSVQAAPGQTPPALRIETLSTRPGFVTGGDVLVRVTASAGAAVEPLAVRLNGTDVTGAFQRDSAAPGWTGLLRGLRPGRNDLTAAGRGGAGAMLTLVNHPISGPVLSGPQEEPFVCQTQQFRLPSGQTLGEPLDARCSIATRVDYYYRTPGVGPLKPLAGATPPSDAEQLVTRTGARVPYVIRIETGTINRAIYQIAMLHDPSSGTTLDPWHRSPGWNGRLVYTHGGGCVPGAHRQGANTGGVVDDVILRQGFAVASSSLNVSANNCSDLIASETLMMVKEHFVETYGVPLYTMGWGCSGGSYPQLLSAQNYPGLLDGLVPCRTFPDVASATVPTITDARLMNVYFGGRAGVAFSDAQRRAVGGFLLLATMKEVDRDGAGRIHVTEPCPDVLPAALRYDAASRPSGVRCDIYDHSIAAYGRDPATGFARRPLDNVGVQYGLGALNAGIIDVEQFLDLNEKIGGFDGDGNVVARRTAAAPAALAAAARSGRILRGSGLGAVPIIDYRNYLDDDPDGNVHVRFQSFSLRERLRRANGHLDNYVTLVEDDRFRGNLSSPVYRTAFEQMDRWLTGIAEDRSSDPAVVKMRRHRPAGLADTCWTRDAVPQPIVETQTRARDSRCEQIYPSASFPREVAGASIANDVVKCQLRPVAAADYRVAFSDAQRRRLSAIFADGVCDWTRPGVEAVPPAGTWQQFGVD